jgi:hypothetical protein
MGSGSKTPGSGGVSGAETIESLGMLQVARALVGLGVLEPSGVSSSIAVLHVLGALVSDASSGISESSPGAVR